MPYGILCWSIQKIKCLPNTPVRNVEKSSGHIILQGTICVGPIKFTHPTNQAADVKKRDSFEYCLMQSQCNLKSFLCEKVDCLQFWHTYCMLLLAQARIEIQSLHLKKKLIVGSVNYWSFYHSLGKDL